MQTDAISVLETLISDAEENIHLWRFIAGAVFALKEYDHLSEGWPKSDQSDDFYKDEALKLLISIRNNSIPPSNWLRGFFYNAAVMRLDAAWERSMRIILADSNDANGPELYKRLCGNVQMGLPIYKDSSFRSVRKEVNALKHDERGVPEPMREQPEILRKSLQDLMALVEHKFAKPAT